MNPLRRGVRQLAIAWLLFQAVSLSALAGWDCCATHRAVMAKEEAKSAEAAEAAPCPMHAAAARNDVSQTSDQQKRDKCVLRGTCDGPMAALFAFLSNYGVPPESIATTPDFEITAASKPVSESLLLRLESPDSPPPRA